MKSPPSEPAAQTTTERQDPANGWHNIKARIFDESRRFLLLFVYLWILFGLFVLNETIILRQRGIVYSSHGFALLNALVLAKVMLVAEDLNIGSWMKKRPLIFPILHDALLFTILFICFHVLERIAVGIFKGQTIEASLPSIGGGGILGLLCVGAILFLSLLPYFAFRNLRRELGAKQIDELLFGSPKGRVQ